MDQGVPVVGTGERKNTEVFCLLRISALLLADCSPDQIVLSAGINTHLLQKIASNKNKQTPISDRNSIRKAKHLSELFIAWSNNSNQNAGILLTQTSFML